MTNDKKDTLNIYQKLAKIRDSVDVIQKNKAGYNYKYVDKTAILAKLTPALKKNGIALITALKPGTLEVTPYTYETMKQRKEKDKSDKLIVVDYKVINNEFIVKAEVVYTWINIENPEEKIENTWGYVGMMADPSQAFGAAVSYCSRYYLIESLSLAITDEDPDAYRSERKRKAQEEAEKLEKEVLQPYIDEVVAKGSDLIKNGLDKKTMMSIVAKYNDGNGNPSSLKKQEDCEAVLNEFNNLNKPKKATTNKETKNDIQ